MNDPHLTEPVAMPINDESDPDLAQKKELWQTAYHEAGHAVIARRLGVPIDFIELTIERSCEGHWVDRWNGAVRRVAGDLSDSTVRKIALAGIFAEASYLILAQDNKVALKSVEDLAKAWAPAIVNGTTDEKSLQMIATLGCGEHDLEWPDDDFRIVRYRLNGVAANQVVATCTGELIDIHAKVNEKSTWRVVDSVAKELFHGTAVKRTYIRRLDGVAFENIFVRNDQNSE